MSANPDPCPQFVPGRCPVPPALSCAPEILEEFSAIRRTLDLVPRMIADAAIPRESARPLAETPVRRILMTREVSDHRWHFSTAMRQVAADLARARGGSIGLSRAFGYVNEIDGNGDGILDLARRRAAWHKRTESQVVLVSPGPHLSEILHLAEAADLVVVVVIDEGTELCTTILDSLELLLLADGEDLVRVSGHPVWPRRSNGID